jgi:hypothetical protein
MTVGSDYANTEQYNLSTDLNVTPYYDDYEDKKEYYRILYKPGFAVQGRELTQMQTILQKQITRFGRHIFEEGTIVIPGNFQLFANNDSSASGALDYVKIKDYDTANNPVILSNLDGVLFRGATSNVTAYVNIVADGSELSTNTKTLYIDYRSPDSVNTAQKIFMNDEVLISNVGNVVTIGTNATGKGSAFRITEGVIFSKEHFVYFPEQEVILDRYNDNPTAKVGFNVIENIVDYTGDSSLLDPALESSNYSAPGADRLKLTAVLESRAFDDEEGVPNFTTLFTIKNGLIQTYNQRTQYSILKDELAKRTFDESGDYYVSGLDVELRENADSGTNGGLLPASVNPDANSISVRINPGTAYVKGYEVGIIRPEYLITPKSTQYVNVNSQIASAFMGSYVTANNMSGHLELDEGITIDLLDRYNRRVSNGIFTAAAVGNTIGTATVMSIEYNSGVLGTSDGRVDIYITDIRMLGSNSFSSVKSLYSNNTSTADFGADIVPDSTTNTTILREPFNAPLLYYTGSNFTRKVKDKDDLPDTTYYYTTTIPVTIASDGSFTATAPGSDSLPYTGTLSTSDKRELFLNLEESVNVAMSGTVSSSGTANVISGISTFFTRLNAGEKVQFSGHSNTYTVLSTPTSDTGASLILAEPALYQTVSALSTLYRHYGAGSFIDLTTKGVTSGTVRSVTAATPTLTLNLNETFPAGGVTAALSFRAARTSAIEAGKILRPSRYVKINCASVATTSGPFDLGFSDVYRIKSIVKKSSSFPTSNTDGILVTSQFIFNNGQKDALYDIATIKPTSSLASTDRLLVELDYFAPDFSVGKGYFTVDSYPIPVNDVAPTEVQITTAEIPIYTSPSSGKKYDLRNHIDFRPVKSLTANDVTDPASVNVTENPLKSNTFNFINSTLALASPSSEIIFDYSYYVARKDIIHVSKNKVFSITQGQPGSLPIAPKIPEDELAIAELTISPFPSISPYYAKLIGRQDIASSSRRLASVRQTMRDLGIMKSRIANLEYYASLSLLEKSAADMLIQDEDGLDRFKNGIFVDTFRDHSLGDTKNSDYRIVVDPAENSIRPLYSMQSINYDYLSGSNVKRSGDLITLHYNEVEYANISSVTATLNTEKSTYRFVGNMILVPESDIWIDTITLPPNVIDIQDANLDGLGDAQQVGGVTTTWNAWKTHVSGYTVYKGEGATKTLVGTYTSLTDAQAAAQNIRTTKFGATIETSYVNERTGSETYTYSDTDSVSTGSKVVNTDIVPYIRPQAIIGSVTGIKPYAKYKVFFDSIDMTSYVRPVTYAEYQNAGNITSWTNSIGDDLLADANGELWFRLSLPNTDNLRFTVGTKLVRVTDSLTNTDEETSFAEKTFFAQGMIQTKQDTILSTRQVDVRNVPLFETNNSNSFETLPPLTPPKRPKVNVDINFPQNQCCFVPNSMVTMADGTKKSICDIKTGDNVLSRNGSAIVTDIIITDLGNRELYGFAGHEPFATEDHPFLTNKGWSSYKIGDYHNHLVRDNVPNINWDPMTNEEEVLHTSGFVPVKEIVTEKDDADKKVYALTLDDSSDHTYWVEDFLTHNKNGEGHSKACLAYVMPISVPDGEEGIFLTSVDIFCAQRHPTLGMWCEVRELDTGGGITGNAVPFSAVWFRRDEIPESLDGKTNPLNVAFESPLFLYANKSYAFIIHPEASNPNYYFWISRIGQPDRNTNLPVTGRAYNGATFTTNNDTIWVLEPRVDLTCKWYRASFTVGSGYFEIGNQPKEKLYLDNIVGSLEGFGEPFVTGDRITLSAVQANTGDYIIGQSSGVNARVISISSGTYKTSNIRFTANESVTIKYGANGVTKGATATPGTVTIASITRGVGYLEYYKNSPTSTQMILTSSNGKFSAGETIFDISDEGSANIASINNLRYSVIDFEPTVINFVKTSTSYEMATYSNSSLLTADAYFSFDAGENYTFDEEKAIYSRSNEIALLSSNYSNKVKTTLSTSSPYVSPVFDLRRTHSIVVDNLVNSNTANEASTQGGQLFNKYISKIVTLADYQDAEDMNVFLTAYRPPDTDVKVWMKLLNGEDSDPMTQKVWIEMEKSYGGDVTYSSIANKNDFKEYKYLLPAQTLTTGGLDANGIFTYKNSADVQFTTFKSFQIKVGILANNSAVIPRVADLRTIALQI